MSKEVIKPEEFTSKIKKLIKQHDEETVAAVNEVAFDEAKHTVRDIKAASKAAFGTGKYQRGWTKNKKKLKEGYCIYVIKNKTHYMLTHLLEYGHRIWIHTGNWKTDPKKGRLTNMKTKPQAHIRPTAENAAERYFTAIKERLNK